MKGLGGGGKEDGKRVVPTSSELPVGGTGIPAGGFEAGVRGKGLGEGSESWG